MLNELLELKAFIDRGGSVMWVLLLWLFAIWGLILGRVMGARYLAVEQMKPYQNSWRCLPSPLRRRLHPVFQLHLRHYLLGNHRTLNGLVASAPLLGLLGTVMGMVHIFEALAFAGSAQLQFMSAGIAKATFPTMLGMLVAISGVLGVAWTQSAVRRWERVDFAALDLNVEEGD